MVTCRDAPGRMVNVAGVMVRFGFSGAVTVIGPLNPLTPVALIVTTPSPPARMPSEGGAAVMVKSGRRVTVSVSVALRGAAIPGAMPLNRPATTMGEVPGATAMLTFCVAPAARVKVDGVNVTPGTCGVTTFTTPSKPLRPVTPTATVALPPSVRASESGVTVRRKSGGVVMVRRSGADRVPLTPCELPANCSERVPAAALVLTVSVTVCVPPGVSVNAGGLKMTSGVDGEVITTVALKLLIDVTVTATLAVAPGCSVNAGGFTLMSKSGAPLTVTSMVNVLTRLPAAYVRVIGYVPGAVAAEAWIDIGTAGPEVDTGFGLTLRPGGCPDAVTVTLPLKQPFCVNETFTVCAPPPAVSASADGLANGVKFGSATLTCSWMLFLTLAAGSLMSRTTNCVPLAAPFAEMVNGMVWPGGICATGGDVGLTVMPGGIEVNWTLGRPL